MNTQILEKIEKAQIKTDIPQFVVGDTVAVHTIIRDKDKQRIQIFKGIVIAIKGSGTRTTFTVRKITSGIGVEKIFPLHSTNIAKIEFAKKGKVRRSKLYYMRNRIGKQATKITEGEMSEEMKAQHESLNKEEVVEEPAVEAAPESKVEEKVEVKSEAKTEAEPEAKAEETAEEKTTEDKAEEAK